MNRLQTALSLSMLSLAGLTGCAGLGTANFPNASMNPQSAPLGTIQGSDFGGHAPLVGAHVYVLQPGVTGYGSIATSLLTASTPGTGAAYATAANASDPHIPTGASAWYYETTDKTGAFNISGDYTCVVGQPVYLYLYGGSPTFPSGSNLFTVSSVTVTGTASPYTVTMTTTTTENAYVGETFTIGTGSAGLVGTGLTSLNGTTPVVIAGSGSSQLSTTTFSFTSTAALTAGTYAQTNTGQITFNPTNNPGVVNLAVLGNCPNGTTNAGFGTSIKYVYVNEVSTAAAATVFAPFTLSSNNDAAHIGTSATNLLGIENAALTAGNLYDIQGSSISTTYAGEGHIARPFTAAGNGIVPQATLDTIGNILAQCVDSNNTGTTIGAGGISSQCTTLFTAATNTGVPTTASTSPGTQPFDTAAAALNIARHPAGAPANTTTFMANLYGLPTGNPPFAPNLTAQPNDFGIAILYPASKTVGSTTVTNSGINSPEAISVDGSGNVIIENYASPSVMKFSNLGVNSFTTSYGGNSPGYAVVDPANNIWVGTNVTNYVTELNNSGAFISTGASDTTGYLPYTGVSGYNAKYTQAQAITMDGANNAYIADANNTGNGYRVSELSGTGAVSSTSYVNAVATCFGTTVDRQINHLATDSLANGYNLWLTSEGNATNGAGSICRINTSTGVASTGFTTTNQGVATTTTAPEFISVDSSGNAWIPAGYNGTPELLQVTTGGAVTPYTTGATFNYPFGSTIDGNNTVWVADRGNGNIMNFNIANSAFANPSTNYKAGQVTTGLLNIAADPSGNLWSTDYFGNNFVEFVGMAAPTYTPIALAAKNNKLGVAP